MGSAGGDLALVFFDDRRSPLGMARAPNTDNYRNTCSRRVVSWACTVRESTQAS